MRTSGLAVRESRGGPLLGMLLRVQSSILTSATPGDMLQSVCDSAFSSEDVPGVFVALYDEATQRLEPAAYPARLAPYREPIRAFLNSKDAKQRSPVLKALHTGAPQFVADMGELRLPVMLRGVAALLGVRGLAALPLHRGGRPTGVLALYVKSRELLDDAAREALWAVALNVSQALERFDERQRLVDSEVRFRLIVEQSIVGIYMVDESRFIYGNARLCEVLGLTPQELLRKSLADVVHPEDYALVLGKVRERVSGAAQDARYEFRILKPDGTVRDVGVHGRRIDFEGRHVVMGVLQDITDRVRAEKTVGAQLQELREAMHGAVTAVSRMMQLRDSYTAGHERRVASIACAIGGELGLDASQIEGLDVIGGLHDIGKIGVPAEILSKPSHLTSIEYALVQEHARTGHQILAGIKFPWPVADAVLQHHERIDGSGYPQGLKNGAILLEARILGIADVVESMASHRPYRAALGVEAALAEIESGLGKLYDIAAGVACLRLFRQRGYRIPD
jgi:PAS domain S-box-containing protein